MPRNVLLVQYSLLSRINLLIYIPGFFFMSKQRAKNYNVQISLNNFGVWMSRVHVLDY